MKIFYATTTGRQNHEAEQRATEIIPDILTKMGHSVYVYVRNPRDSSKKFDDITDAIVSADVFIGEMSRPSQTLGFQLSYALSITKPSLYTYDVSVAPKAAPGVSLMRNPSRLLRVKPYDATSLKHVLGDFIEYANGQLQSVRTSFMSTHRIDNFVSTRSALLGISKAEVIRQLLNDAMENTK